MGYEVGAYCVPEGEVERFFGSGDRATAETVIAAQSGRMRDRADAVLALCDGAVADGSAARYLYATEVICAHFGARLPESIRLNPQGIEASGELKLLLRTHLPIKLRAAHDFPEVGFMPLAVIDIRRKKLAAFGRGEGARPSWMAWPEELASERDIYLGWMQRAAELRGDVWVFYY